MLDIKIAGGTVIDGSGAAPARADVGIAADRVVQVGDLSKLPAAEEISAVGRIVCPGFIDVHSHSDAYLLIEPSAPSKIHQGVTTEVVGNCGCSAAPHFGDHHFPSDWEAQEYPGAWHTMAEYRALLEKVGPAPNVVMLVGHGNLRASVIGYGAEKAGKDRLDTMTRMLAEALDEGARGLSTGLIYPPGRFADAAEIHALAGVVAGREGMYTSHMRSEGDRVLEAIEEAIEVGKKTGVTVQISHLKCSGKSNWDKRDAALALIEKAREHGINVAADRYPYLAGHTELDVVFPDWAHEGGREALMQRLCSETESRRISEELKKSRSEEAWAGVTIGFVENPDLRGFQGRGLADVARELGMHPVEAVLYIAKTDALRSSAFFFGLSEENMTVILQQPYVMIASDASIRSTTGPLSHDYPHPRAYGTFPRFLRMALDKGTVSLSEAIRKMTSLPAAQFGLKDRGLLEAGRSADIVVFGKDEICDMATYENPSRLARGVDVVLVNGVVALRNGQLTGERAGQIL